MRFAKVLLLASALLLGGWSESHAEAMSVMNWDYYAPFTSEGSYFYQHNFSYNGELSLGKYTLGIIYFTNDNNNNVFGILNNNISYQKNNAIDFLQEYNGNMVTFFYYESYMLTQPQFVNAYKNVLTDSYLSFGAYWNYEHNGSTLSLSVPVLFGWDISDIAGPPYDYYAVFYIQDSTGNMVYSQGLQVGNPPAVPLPGTALLLGSGLAGLALISRRLRRR